MTVTKLFRRPLAVPWWLRADWLWAALALAGLLVIFFWTPLTTGGYYTAADLLQDYPLHKISSGYQPKNPLLGDTVYQMLPFLEFNRRELAQGRLPLWNPHNGWGAPHLANYQSAVLSPYSLPFYLLDLRWALVVSAFAKLYSLGLFTYLFLRRVGIVPLAALLGAVAFTFGGYHLLWLSWMHVGAVIALPAGLYFAEVAFQTPLTRPARRGLAMLGVAGALAAGLLAGHPETFLFGGLLTGGYVLFRLARLASRRRELGRRLVEFSLAALLALGLAAGQLLPFTEYVVRSLQLAERSVEVDTRNMAAPDEPRIMGERLRGLAPLLAFPDLLGNPARPYHDPALERRANYLEANGHYTGLIILFLAGLTVITLPLHGSSPAAFFGVVGGVWLAYFFNLGDLGILAGRVPLLRLAIAERSQPIWLFCTATLAALAVHLLLTGRLLPPRRSHRLLLAAGLLGAGLVVFGVAQSGAAGLIEWAARQPGNRVASADARAVVPPHQALIGWSFGLAVAGLALIVLLGRGRPWPGRAATGLAGGLLGLVFLQTGWLLRDFNPTIAGQYLYPSSGALAWTVERTGGEQTLWLDGAALPANSNLWHAAGSLANYDALGVLPYETLHRRWLPTGGVAWAAHQAEAAHLRGLQLLGVRYVATDQHRPFAPVVVAQPAILPALPSPARVLRDQPVVQRFRAAAANLALLGLPVTSFGRRSSCTLHLSLVEEASNRQIASNMHDCRAVDGNASLTLAFPPQPDSAGRTYRLTIESPDTAGTNYLGVWYLTGVRDGGLSIGDRTGNNRLLFSGHAPSPFDGLELVGAMVQFRLFRVPDALPPYFSVGQTITTIDDEVAVTHLESAAFDPRRMVVLHTDRPLVASSGAPGRVEVLEATPVRRRLRVERADPGWLVALLAHYPGWGATVDGRPAELLRANVGFSAVAVGAGTSEVVLTYAPLSVAVGLLVSGLALAGSLLALAAWIGRARHESCNPPP